MEKQYDKITQDQIVKLVNFPLPQSQWDNVYNVTAYIEKNASPTCCQPAPESGVTIPDDLTKRLTVEEK